MPKPKPKSKLNVPTFLTKREFAERISVCERTISRAIDAGELRAHRVGRLVRIAEEDAVAFIAARRR